VEAFVNDDTVLLRDVDKALQRRRKDGLDGLVGNLAAVAINTSAEDLVPAAEALLGSTGLRFAAALEYPLAADGGPALLLSDPEGADFLFKSRPQQQASPFAPYNGGLKTPEPVAGRLETFVFECLDLDRYVTLQRRRGVAFATHAPIVTDAFSFIETLPSIHTGNALGFIQWHGRPGTYVHGQSRLLPLKPAAPDRPYLARIGSLDHVATRVRAAHRDAAIVEFLELTNYHFDFAVYVEALNSITNVARLRDGDYAQVFTSGIGSPDGDGRELGPTEAFIANYGLRPHHLAFTAEGIEEVVARLAADGMAFLSDLVGSREEGLKQIFSAMSPHTMLVNEYIERYDGFDGFFTKSNVTRLTKATENQ
jgi:hypothetical protein